MVVKNSPLRHKPLNRDDESVTNSSYAQGYPLSWWIQECKGNIFRSDAAIVLRGTVPPTRTARHAKAGQLSGWLSARLAREIALANRESPPAQDVVGLRQAARQ
jgi:hypothetical protein